MVREFWVSITALLVSIAVLLLGVGLMGTLLSVRLNFEAMHPQVKGLILSAYYIGLVIGSQQAGRVIRQAGHIRAFAIFAALSTVAILLQGLYVAAVSWFLLRVLVGFSISGIYMVVESWLNERADSASRGVVFSVYQIITYAAIGAGQLLMHLGDPMMPDLFMVVGLLFALCLVPVALSRASNPPEPLPHAPMALGAAWRGSRLAVVTCIGAGLLSGAAFSLVPIAVLRMGLSVEQVAPVMAGLVLGGVALQWPIGHFSDRYGRRALIFIVGIATALVALSPVYVGVTYSHWLLVSKAALLGGLAFTLYPLAVSLANDTLPGGNFVSVSAALIFLWGIGAAVSPILGGYIIAHTPAGGLFVYMAVVSGIVAMVAMATEQRYIRIRNPFRTMGRGSPMLLELDPRAHEFEDEEDTPEWFSS